MVARRKKKKTRRKKQGVSILGMAETYMLLNVATQTFFRTNPYVFLMGDYTNYYAKGTSQMSLREIIMKANQHSSGAAQYNTTELIKKNFQNQWFGSALQMAFIPIGFRFAKNLARPAISRTNRLLNKTGIGSTIKL